MQRDLLKSRLSALHPDHALGQGSADEEATEELDELPELGAPSSSARRKRQRHSEAYTPLSASQSFAQALEVDVIQHDKKATFRTYYTPPSTTSETHERASNSISQGQVVFVCVHGAGYSGLSFARFAEQIASVGAGALAYDARGHGKTVTDDDGQLSLETMASDLVALLKTMFPEKKSAPSLVLVGHSMGGAVVVEACNTIMSQVAPVTGVAVIDVVEGTALDALDKMKDIIARYPSSFDSVEEAIEWHLTSRTLNNADSARVSVPSLVRQEGEKYLWRIDLASTEPYWRGWFEGLSSKFLACRTAKLLLLSGKEVLDKDLMIGQMQGKFQLEVFPDVGHCMHEDTPERAADVALAFHERNDRSNVIAGVKKVGEK